MKTYFTQLFDYDRFANLLILETILTANEPQKPVQLMAHLLTAQQVWLSRCKCEPAIAVALWPDWPSDQLGQMINNNHRAWIDYMNTLNEDDFDKLISYKNLQGIPFENKLVDMLTQVINHGTHHRAQAGQQLKFAGVEKLPITDYIFYIRD
ncbi:MAG: hypothetical protein JWR67_842 [Mucilaginibacter sp.]|nr:hypothetical protein [Mucilaginibacter sp.]